MECVQRIRIIDVNQATLDLYEARSKRELIENIDRIIGNDSLDTFRKEMVALITGDLPFQGEFAKHLISGKKMYNYIRLSIARGYEETWAKVFLSVIDTTEWVRARRELKENETRFQVAADRATELAAEAEKAKPCQERVRRDDEPRNSHSAELNCRIFRPPRLCGVRTGTGRVCRKHHQEQQYAAVAHQCHSGLFEDRVRFSGNGYWKSRPARNRFIRLISYYTSK